MRKAIYGLIPVFLAVLLAGCGGGMSSSQVPAAANSAQVSLTIHDNPPIGATVLSFEMEVMSATLQPKDPMSSQPVSMLDQPEDIELEHLQTESALLASKSVSAGTYNSLTVSFANPRMTIQNQTGTMLMLGSQMCADKQVCEFSPKLNLSSVTVQAPTQPFPITLNMNSPVVLKMDFNIDASIQSTDFSITPTISLIQLPPPTSNGGNQGDEDMEIVGNVTSIGQSTFMIQTGMNGPSYTIVTDSNTHFDFGTSCSSASFSCLQKGQIVRVEAKLQSDGSLLATEVKVFQLPSQITFAGTVTSVNSSGTFQIVLFDEEDFSGDQNNQGNQNQMGSLSMGIPLTISLASSPKFSIDTDSFTLPSGLNFAAFGDFMVGQEVRLHPNGMVSGTPPNITVTVDQVQLEASHVTAKITAINPGSNPMTLTLGTLPPLFMNANLMNIQVDVLSTTQIETEEDQTMSGLGSLNVGDTVSVRGPLFNTTTPPTLVGEKVVKRSTSSGTQD